MADSKSVVVEAKLTFGSTAYDCKSLPAGIPQTCDLPDVTVMSDVEKRFAQSALVEDGELQAVIAGDCSELVGTKASLSISLKVSAAGAAAVAETVSVGDCICTGVEPSTIEAGGDRVQTWTVTFKPDGTRT